MEVEEHGKTSAAKILARAINCLNPHDGEPCNECEICKEILLGSLTDVVEMDAASNNSVEDIRGIREEVNFLPTRARYRVYIIDEVHMLSIGAFNALLKTLEEPPEHVKFILATTEPQKLPATILSRCQRFDFKRISNTDIIKRLKVICEQSNINITDEALKTIAILSEGAMRDGISILERCVGEHEGVINENYVRDLVGMPKTAQIYSIVRNIIESNVDEVINITNDIINQGKDIDNFLWEIIKYIKDILVYKSSKSLDLYNDEEKKQIDELVNNVSKQKLLDLIYTLSEAANTIKWSSQKAVMFQAILISACIEKVVNFEIKTAETNDEQKSDTKLENKKIAKQQPKKEVKQVAKEKSFDYWNNVIDKIKQSGKMGIYVNLIGSVAKEANDMVLEVELANKNSFAKDVLEAYENKSEIEKIVSIEAGKTMSVKFVSKEDKKKANLKEGSIENIINELDIPINIIDK
ncbi:MAG: DNA polymerase III subunit gamma/tau [Clostridia bacterium]|nr:DNA polymerase III subunit gamma/tau [Clostridia bacterium]